MKDSPSHHVRSERMIFILPKSLAADLEEYADVLRGGNKGGFVADALRSYMGQFRKRRHTALLRRSYAAASTQSRTIAEAWELLDDELWRRFDKLEKTEDSLPPLKCRVCPPIPTSRVPCAPPRNIGNSCPLAELEAALASDAATKEWHPPSRRPSA